MKWTKVKTGIYKSGDFKITLETASAPRKYWRIHWADGHERPVKVFYKTLKDAKKAVKAHVHAFAPTDEDMEVEARANAHLIAAAPELLEALKATLAYALGQVTDCDLIETTAQARDAIAKAEGKQS